MDDFLHNLRSGKLKQTDRNRRDFADYKGPQRRVTNDRRKTDYYAKVTNENFALIKETLDVLADCQKRIADAMVEKGKSQTRIACALEMIAKMMSRHLGMEDSVPQAEAAPVAAGQGQNQEIAAPPASPDDELDDEGGDDEGHPDLFDMISAMRDQGDSWEKIARTFDEQDVPTISGKGKWRGPAVKRFWSANVQS